MNLGWLTSIGHISFVPNLLSLSTTILQGIETHYVPGFILLNKTVTVWPDAFLRPSVDSNSALTMSVNMRAVMFIATYSI